MDAPNFHFQMSPYVAQLPTAILQLEFGQDFETRIRIHA